MVFLSKKKKFLKKFRTKKNKYFSKGGASFNPVEITRDYTGSFDKRFTFFPNIPREDLADFLKPNTLY